MRGYQQGDVILKCVAGVPVGAKPCATKNGKYVLAEGETTGHAHRVEATNDVEMFEKDGTLYLRVVEEAQVQHEEHLPQTLQPGVYEIGIVKEVDPFTDEVRAVRD